MEALLSDDELYLPSDRVARVTRPVRLSWDDDVEDPEASTYLLAEHGPEPAPAWVITADAAARQHERGLLKTGKEADVFLVERQLDERTNLLAAKRYRSFEDRMFRNDSRYRQGRRTGNTRTDRAVAHGSRTGMAFRARQWVETEFEILGRLWSAGASVPYPVQRLGPELMIEYIGTEASAAPRLAQYRGSPNQLADLYGQLVDNLRIMAAHGVVHGDLSPYNLLVFEDRLVVIDLPQAVDPILNPDGLSLLQRDVINTCAWFDKHGVTTDASEVIAELIGMTF